LFSTNTSTIGEESTEAASPASTIQNSIALKYLCDNFPANKRYNILDLGPAYGENIAFFSEFARKIYIEDLRDTLCTHDFLSGVAETGGEIRLNVGDTLTAYPADTRFDLIFAWDLFNYLEREPLQQVIAWLSKFCKTGTLIFSLISTRVQISQHPLTFKILDKDRLLYGSSSALERPHPRYREVALLKLMPHFKTQKSFLLRNGMQEYLFIHQ